MYSLLIPMAIIASVFWIFRPEFVRWISLIIALPFFGLAFAFMLNDTSLLHVASNGGENLPLKYRFAATWSAREGPLLLWAAWMALLAHLYAKPMIGESKFLASIRLRFMGGFALTLLFLGAMMEPFQTTPTGFQGRGLNELLQTDLMVIHPPLIFLAYAYCIMLSCIGLTAFWETNFLKDRMIQITRPAMFVSTLGIGLGGLWAYTVLDWGGYWAWDPVETGSMLPWLVLVIMLHLRTRPGKTPANHWVGLSFLAGMMALFATLVTRAGGVWASSVHTFVTDVSASNPPDAFSRMVLLKSDDQAGAEIMTYLLMFVILASYFVCFKLNKRPHNAWFFLPPVVAGLGWIFGANYLQSIPSFFFVLIALAPMIYSIIKSDRLSKKWLLPVAVSVLSAWHGLVFLGLIAVFISISMVLEDSILKSWGMASIGVMLHLSAAWSSMIDVYVAGLGMTLFLLPWFFENEEMSEKPWQLSDISWQKKVILWSPIMVVSLYLVLTFVILLSSIDNIQFAAHELYGAPFILAILMAFTAWAGINYPKRNQLLVGLPILALIMALIWGNKLGGNADQLLSTTITRGFIGMLMLIPALFAIPSIISLILKNKGKKIPMAAHMVHLGLVLLILGHIFSTTIVNRGDISHRITLEKNEPYKHGDYIFTFTDVVFETEDLEVGSGFVGITINVSDSEGEFIGEVMPGLIRFDRLDSTGKFVISSSARSEIDIMSRYYGDLVFILDGTQATAIMGGDSEQEMVVRVTVYDLTGIHFVWIGWVLMMIGSLATFVKFPARYLSMGVRSPAHPL